VPANLLSASYPVSSVGWIAGLPEARPCEVMKARLWWSPARASSTAWLLRRLGWCSVPFFVLAILVVLLALVVITAVAYLVARRW
jgi:hypothetical protein